MFLIFFYSPGFHKYVNSSRHVEKAEPALLTADRCQLSLQRR